MDKYTDKTAHPLQRANPRRAAEFDASQKGSRAMETVTLYAPNDLEPGYLSPDGAAWITSGADEYSPCDICGRQIDFGFVCLDGGDWICGDHIEAVPAKIGEALAAEYTERITFHNALVAMRCEIGSALVECFTGAEQNPNRYFGFVRLTAEENRAARERFDRRESDCAGFDNRA